MKSNTFTIDTNLKCILSYIEIMGIHTSCDIIKAYQ